MIETTGLSAPKNLKHFSSGDWADIFIEGDRIYKAIYKEDSNFNHLAKVREGCNIQNSFEDAPKVYSVGLRSDGRIWIEMEYLDGYKPIEDAKCDRDLTKELADKLAAQHINHGDINSRNILVKGDRVMLIDFDQATKEKGGNQSDRNLINRIANLYAI